jgi:hypothetical protein
VCRFLSGELKRLIQATVNCRPSPRDWKDDLHLGLPFAPAFAVAPAELRFRRRLAGDEDALFAADSWVDASVETCDLTEGVPVDRCEERGMSFPVSP